MTDSPYVDNRNDDDDLSVNRPGGSLRRRAEAIQVAHPFRVALLRFVGEHSQERAWRRGAEGEEEVGWQLRKLGENWKVLHSVPLGTGDTDIDHVVIGPSGVFTLNTKNHRGGRVTVTPRAIYVNGTYQPYVAKARTEGRRATARLSRACGFRVDAQPLIAIMASELRYKGDPEVVDVVGRKQVARWLLSQSTVLATDEVDAIYAVARRRSTWVS